MKHIKLYEQFDFEDLSDEELFGIDSNKGPYDDILIYGDSGPSFKCGDRVKVINNDEFYYEGKKGDIGTVITYSDGSYLVCLDDFTAGHKGDRDTDYEDTGGGLFQKILKNMKKK